MKGGLILDAPRIKDFSHEVVFGSAPFLERIAPLNRDASNIPDIFQGQENTCVVCAATWVEQFNNNGVDLSHEWLRDIAHVSGRGATFNQVLEPARKIGILSQSFWDAGLPDTDFEAAMQEASTYKWDGYFYVTDLSPQGIYHALKQSPLIIGVKDWQGVGPHAMAAYDVTEDGQALKCKNWWEGETDTVVPFELVVKAAYPGSLPEGVDKLQARLPFFNALQNKLCFLMNKYVQV